MAKGVLGKTAQRIEEQTQASATKSTEICLNILVYY